MNRVRHCNAYLFLLIIVDLMVGVFRVRPDSKYPNVGSTAWIFLLDEVLGFGTYEFCHLFTPM